MKKKAFIILIITHIVAVAFGFSAGIYALPILIAPPAPSVIEVQAASAQPAYSAVFIRDLEGSDALHWGEGKVALSKGSIAFVGKLAPGPDYKLYLSPEFAETEAEFNRLKPSMVLIGEVKTFENFIVKVSPNIDLAAYNTVVVWCETFGEFITAAKYK